MRIQAKFVVSFILDIAQPNHFSLSQNIPANRKFYEFIQSLAKGKTLLL